MGKWLVTSLGTLALWGLWGLLLKVASSRLDWKSLYVASNSAILLVMVLIFALSAGKLSFSPKYSLVGFLAGLSGTLGYILLILSLEYGGKASVVITLTNMYPAITLALSAVILGERLTTKQIVGIIVALVAVILLSSSSR